MELKKGMKLYEVVHIYDVPNGKNPYNVYSVVIDHFNGSSVYVKRIDDNFKKVYKRRAHFPLSERHPLPYILGSVSYLTDDPKQGEKWWKIQQKDQNLNALIDIQANKIKALSIKSKELILKHLDTALKEDK